MNAYQAHWWKQTSSDYTVLVLLRRAGAAPCHQIHYLQMVTEKLGKAYFWRNGKPPAKSHASFVRFLLALDSRSKPDRGRIAELFELGREQNLRGWVKRVSPLAYALERLAPDLAGDHGPNPEYPWPYAAPAEAPATHRFELWEQLTGTGPGRQLFAVIGSAVREFPRYC